MPNEFQFKWAMRHQKQLGMHSGALHVAIKLVSEIVHLNAITTIYKRDLYILANGPNLKTNAAVQHQVFFH